SLLVSSSFMLFFCTAPALTELYSLSLHDALPILIDVGTRPCPVLGARDRKELLAHGPLDGDRAKLVVDEVNLVHNEFRSVAVQRSEEHTSELQSRFDLVCRLLLEKKKKLTNVQNI